MNSTNCPLPHHIEILYGVPVTPIEELPQKCVCGATITYADELCFVSAPTHEYEPNDVMTVTDIPISEEGYNLDKTPKNGVQIKTTPDPKFKGFIFDMTGEPSNPTFPSPTFSGAVRVVDYQELNFKCDCVDVEMGSYDNQVTLPVPQCLKDIGSTREKSLQEAIKELDQAIEDTINESIAKQKCDDCGHTLTITNSKNVEGEEFGVYEVSAVCGCGAVVEFEISLADAYRIVAEKLTKGDEDKTKQLITAWKEAGVLV